RWINGAVLMGGIVFYVLFAEILGFPLTMAILVTAIVWSLRAKWWLALTTGVLASLGLWSMFELALMVQLPDGFIQGF
ncbi:MAG: tripartite tricarboxylate transporter TctB family protein, partial [Brachybacterium tyrofermentans]